MSVYRRFDTVEFPSLLTTSLADRRTLFTSPTAVRMFIEVLYEVRSEAAFRLLAFVVMPDHMHLVLGSPASGRLAQVLQLVKGRFSRRYNAKAGRSGPLWQSRYHERTLRSEDELFAAIEYVHRNPVAAGLTPEASAFPWSSASGEYATDLAVYLGQAKA